MHPRLVLALAVAAAVALAGLGVVVARRQLLPGTAATAPQGAIVAATDQAVVLAQPAPSLSPSPTGITPPAYLSFAGWSMLDRQSMKTTGSANAETATSTTESMIKVWITADYLRHHPSPSQAVLSELTRMIVNSDDNMAYKYYEINGGDTSITELIKVCGLTHSSRPSLADRWSYTNMTPADAVRMGLCVANGTAAGPQWTNWVLTTMRNVRGTVADQQEYTGGGHWGIIDALPAAAAAQTSIKNGWTPQVYDHNWHVNCLAVNPSWIMAIEVHYRWTSPTDDWHTASNLQQGADACKSIATQVLAAR